MTLQELEEYGSIKRQLEYIDKEIQMLYDPISSPPICSEVHNESSHEGPTVNALRRIDRLREQRAELYQKYIDLYGKFNDWMIGNTDYEIQAIVIYKFILGHSWGETACHMNPACGKNSRAASKKFQRYIDNHPEQFN
jgi:hypothetical protein